jgi:hypothetical protein
VRQELQESIDSETRMNEALFNPLLYKGASSSIVEELSFIEWVYPAE